VLNERSLGPWAVQDEPAKGVNGIEVTVVVDRHGQPVANCGSGSLGEANAQLIAAAPTMLHLLEAAYWEHHDLPEEGRSAWLGLTERLLEKLGVVG